MKGQAQASQATPSAPVAVRGLFIDANRKDVINHMTKNETQNMCIKLCKRAHDLDGMFQANQISQERYMTERTAIDVVMSFAAAEIGYEPFGYLRYTDIIAAKELAKAKEKTASKLEAELQNKSKAELEAKLLFDTFMAGVRTRAS